MGPTWGPPGFSRPCYPGYFISVAIATADCSSYRVAARPMHFTVSRHNHSPPVRPVQWLWKTLEISNGHVSPQYTAPCAESTAAISILLQSILRLANHRNGCIIPLEAMSNPPMDLQPLGFQFTKRSDVLSQDLSFKPQEWISNYLSVSEAFCLDACQISQRSENFYAIRYHVWHDKSRDKISYRRVNKSTF